MIIRILLGGHWHTFVAVVSPSKYGRKAQDYLEELLTHSSKKAHVLFRVLSVKCILLQSKLNAHMEHDNSLLTKAPPCASRQDN